MRVSGTWNLHLLVIVMSSMLPLLAAGSQATSMSERLVEIGLQVELQIELAQYNLERGALNQAVLKRHAEAATIALDGLEGQLFGLPANTRDPLLAKLEAVRAQADNLALAAELGSAPPRRGASDSSIRRIDSGDQRRAAPANDDCVDSFALGLGSSFGGDTTAATNDGEAVCGASPYSPDVWFRLAPTTSGTVVVETIGSSFDTVLSVHSGCPGTMSNQIVCNDDAVGLQSAVSFDAEPGNKYSIRLSGANGATGAYVVTLSEDGSIDGMVTATGTGEPIDIRVEAFDEAGYQIGYDYTDATGSYRIAGLESGSLFIATDGSFGTFDELYDDLPCPGGGPYGCDVTTGDAVPVVAGAVTSGIDFVLDLGAIITGVVQAASSGLPLPETRVKLYSETGSYLGSRDTDSLGAFSFTGLADGGYRLITSSSLYLDELYNDIPCLGGPPYGCTLADGTLVQTAINTTAAGIDFALEKRGAIVGTVIDQATSLPISYADVDIYDDQWNQIGGVYTESTGIYEIGGLEDGAYFLTANHYNDYFLQLFDGVECPLEGCQSLTGTPVVISNQATVTGIDFDLRTKGRIAGTVIDSTTSMPIESVLVRAYDSSGSAFSYDYTDTAGIFVIERLDAGTYFAATGSSAYFNELYDGIQFPAGTDPTIGSQLAVVDGQTTSGIDFSLISKGKITGSVTAEDGSGGVRTRVLFYNSIGNYWYLYSNDDGTYEVSLDDGQYFVVADKSYPFLGELYDNIACWGGPPEWCVVTDGTPVTAAAATVTSGIDFVVKRGGTISGFVLDEFDGTPASGRVYVHEVAGPRIWSDELSEEGAYSVVGLTPGDYLVVTAAYSAGHGLVDEVWQDIPCTGTYPAGCNFTRALPVTIGPASEATIDFSLQRMPTISGTVGSAEDGSPLSGFILRAFDTNGDHVSSAYTDSSGRYTFSGFWPATLFVATDRRDQDYVDQLFDGIDCPRGPFSGCDPTTGSPLVVDAITSLEGVDFNLRQAGGISGQITDQSTGLPMEGIRVELWDAAGNFQASDSTDSTGLFVFGGLGARSFYLATDEFYSNGTHLDMSYDGFPCPTGPPEGCDPTKGTPVWVAHGVITRFVDIALPNQSEAGISGMVSTLGTGEPIPGIYIDIWHADTGAYEGGALSSPAGTFTLDLDPGTYVAATDNSSYWLNQVFDGIDCSGSPFNGDCDPLLGTVITVEEGERTLAIDFLLRPALFSDGFESGDSTRWSVTVP